MREVCYVTAAARFPPLPPYRPPNGKQQAPYQHLWAHLMANSLISLHANVLR